jgi:sulfide:quinone oxidoreductase
MAVERIAVSDDFSVSTQITAADVAALAAAGVRSLVCNRPDGEANDQPTVTEIRAAADTHGLQLAYVPVVSGRITPADVADFAAALEAMAAPVHAYCRTGTRSITLWSLHQQRLGLPAEEILQRAGACGYDLRDALARFADREPTRSPAQQARDYHDILIVGAGAAGISVASSLMSRTQALSIAIIDPAEVHYYQPGWTMVGGGIFTQQDTVRTMASLIPRGVTWIKAAVGNFEPDENRVLLEDSHPIYYDRLIVAPGIKLDWHGVEDWSRPLAATVSPPTTASISLPIPGNWSVKWARAGRCSHSRRCRSSAPARRRKPCISRRITGGARASSMRSTSVFTMPAAYCSAFVSTCRR